MNNTPPHDASARRWLAEGLRQNLLDEETAAAIAGTLAGLKRGTRKMIDDGGCIYPTAATKILAEELNTPFMAAEAACDVCPDSECP